MLDAKTRAELDQVRATMVELFPPMWKSLCDALLEEKFDELQAMELLKTYIMSQGLNGPQV